MQVGISLNMLSQAGRVDASVLGEHMRLGDLAEPLGFDSLFALEHHFTGYAMSPAPLQMLAYYAGRTKRIMMGTGVIVLPWHDPIRVAEQIALLDIMSGGRCVFGFGRGAARIEYEGFRIPMEEARPRFKEALEIVQLGLTQSSFEYAGEFYQIPRTSIRPAPISHPERRFYGSANSPESAKLIASSGLGLLIVMHNEWPKAAHEVYDFHQAGIAAGHAPRPPIIVTNISCAESRAEADERAKTWLGKKWDSVDNHYQFSDGGLSSVKGYEAYSKIGRTYAKMADTSHRQKMTDTYVKIQIVGTPDDCIAQIDELRTLTGLDHLVCEFAFGGMPHEDGERNMRLFANQVLPVLKSDARFTAKPKIITSPAEVTKNDSVFMPA
ncbi:MAG: LLM class flavin-dependent oxidoreductase [Acetobacteraceae bacterium]|nr:LLM class flavin-dependent oxidoreductase [Acetobacteraceae bacterium]MSP29395.1 LLM class flavin-dependent oxidoreductase [Acetobacteraceae bacterium]